MKYNMLVIILRYLKRLFETTNAFIYDYVQFIRYSGVLRRSNQDVRKFLILQDLHKIEKGLTLSSPRANFGQAVWQRIKVNLSASSGDLEDVIGTYCVNVYTEYNKLHKITNPNTRKYFAQLSPRTNPNSYPVTKLFTPTETQGQQIDMVISKRRSVRQFTGKVPQIELINMKDIVKNTPTVCNRAHINFECIEDRLLLNALELQNGNESFRDQIKQVLVIFSRTTSMNSPYERNQVFIDGGMYAMNVLNYLAFKGYGTVPLNWSSSPSNDVKLRKLLSFPNDAKVIMLIAIGACDRLVTVATSTKLEN